MLFKDLKDFIAFCNGATNGAIKGKWNLLTEILALEIQAGVDEISRLLHTR